MPAIVAYGRTMGERPGLICGLVAGSEPDAVTDEHSDAVWMGLRSVEECAVVVDETAVVTETMTETMIVAIDREVEIEEDEEIGISNVWNLNAEIATLLLETIHSCIQFYPSLI